ncbi:hypothetical protein DFQ26_004620 [Actinomortierella ambigua]|nr:hypothetical protein DFQ26_004620 [Actinomortierella ambigua]
MSSPVAAATVQNDILLVQYSPTGNGIGDLYAIVLSDLKKPLPFQIQRQIPELQAMKGDVASMSLASIPSFGGSNPTAPGAAPPGSSPAAAAVVAAPPFRDVVLSVNAAGSTQAWHVKGPGRGVPPGATYSNPLAPLWGASKIPSTLFPKATSINFGTHTPQGPKNPGILAVLRTTSDALVAVADGKVYVNQFARYSKSWKLKNPANNAPNINGSVVACTTSNNIVIIIVPDSSGVQTQPGIHFFDLNTSSWAKAQLVTAPPGTFSDIPPIPPPSGNSGSPGKGSPDKGGPSHSDVPSTSNPSSVSATTSHAGLIGGIVGGIVVLGVLIFVGFFFSRRRGSKQKGQHQSELALKPLDGNNGLYKEQGMHDRERSDRGDGGSLAASDYQEKTWPSESYQHKIASPQAQAKARPRVNNPQTAYPPVFGQHEIALPQAQEKARSRMNNPQAAYPPVFGQHEIAWPQAGSPQETIQQQIINSQDMDWSPANSHRRTVSSRADSPRKSTRSRVNSPHEVTRAATLPVVHRTNNPQYDPNQQL